MNTLRETNANGDLDREIEQDVAELRRLLQNVKGPTEPHPAYHQNFLVKVRERIEEEGVGRKRRWSPTLAWGGLGAAALVVILAVTGVLPWGNDDSPGILAGDTGPIEENVSSPLYDAPAPSEGLIDSDADLLYTDQESRSLVLSTDDVQMLNALMSDDDDAIFEAMLEAEPADVASDMEPLL